MANSPTTPVAEENYPMLEVLDASGGILDTVPVIKAGGHAYSRNRRGYQAFDSDSQAASGDGRRVVGARTIDLLIQAGDTGSGARLHALDVVIEGAASLRLEGVTIALAGSGGFTATQPLTDDRDGDLRATLTYYPATQAATTTGGAPVLGPL